MSLGTGHQPLEPQRMGRPPCRRSHRSRQGLPRVTGGGLHALDAALIAAVVIGLLLAALLLVADPWLPPIHDL